MVNAEITEYAETAEKTQISFEAASCAKPFVVNAVRSKSTKNKAQRTKYKDKEPSP